MGGTLAFHITRTGEPCTASTALEAIRFYQTDELDKNQDEPVREADGNPEGVFPSGQWR